MGIPIAAGARILAINNDITKDVPKTMEELEADAIKINKPPKVYGLIMPGQGSHRAHRLRLLLLCGRRQLLRNQG